MQNFFAARRRVLPAWLTLYFTLALGPGWPEAISAGYAKRPGGRRIGPRSR